MKPTLPLFAALTLIAEPAHADTVLVAVAAHFAPTLQGLAPAFQQATGHTVQQTAGSTGKLHAHIVQGAPFEVLLAADVASPMRLEASGHAVAGSRFTYAIGRLVLWSRTPGLVDGRGDVLRSGRFAKLALASPKLAPYGAAADDVLRRLGLMATVRPKLVFGESVAQAFQFVATGNADLGFVAQSQLSRQPDVGSRWLVPMDLHAPLRHDAVLLQPGKDQPAAVAFLRWLRAPTTARLVRQAGYDVPARP